MGAVDNFQLEDAPNYPSRHAAAVAPNDNAELGFVTKQLFVGGAGNIVLVTAAGETVTLTGVAAGTILNMRVRQVKATNTTATNMVALW